jgi:hypothetical protein
MPMMVPGKKPPAAVPTKKVTVKKAPTTVVVTKKPQLGKETVTTKTTTTTTTKIVPLGGGTVVHGRRVRARHARHRRRVRHSRSTHKSTTVSSNYSFTSGAETSLVGIHLFDSGMKVLAMYGNPDRIENPGGASGGGGGGGGGGLGGGAIGGGFGGGGGGTGGGGAAPAPQGRRPGSAADWHGDFSFEDDTLLRAQSAGAGPPRFGPAGGLGGGPPQAGGGGAPGPGFGGAGGSAPAPAAAGGGGEPATFTRWVYKREFSEYSFIIDHQNRVVQIEAVGMGDSKVRTNRGVSFGATFKQIMKIYNVPDAYELGGDTLVMRYLNRNKVAFRLNRLHLDQPHVVTAIVVSGGKA